MDQMPPVANYLVIGLCLGLGALMLAWRKGPNWWIGVRLPWTYADREIWNKSWRLAATFLVGMGLGLLVSWKFFLIAMAHLIILGILYPVYLYRRKYGTLRYWKGAGWLEYRPVIKCQVCGHLQRLHEAGDPETTPCAACGGSLRRG